MTGVSLTTFIDFVGAANPTTRISLVKQAKEFYEDDGTPYEVKAHYLALKRALIAHLTGDHDAIERCLHDVSARRTASYESNVEGFRKWEKEDQPGWIARPTKKVWRSGGLEVVVNPEIAVTVRDQAHTLKLYLKREKLSQRKVEPMLHLMALAVGQHSKPGILDVRRAKTFTYRGPMAGIDVLLEAEALALAHMWSAL